MTILNRYKPIAESIAKLLHPFAEVVLHNIKNNKIEAIYNNYSKREPGDNSLIDNTEALSKGPEVNGPFIKNDFYGNQVKYTSTLLKDNKNNAIGLLCININMDNFNNLQNMFNLFFKTEPDSSEFDNIFEDNWQERIRAYVNKFLTRKMLNLSNLSKSERLELVNSLYKAGAFRVKNAANFTANVLGVSRATIYNDLAEFSIEK